VVDFKLVFNYESIELLEDDFADEEFAERDKRATKPDMTSSVPVVQSVPSMAVNI
jgi:hypothetical protein